MDVWHGINLDGPVLSEVKRVVLSCQATLSKPKGKNRGQALVCLRKILKDEYRHRLERFVAETVGIKTFLNLLRDSRMREQTMPVLEMLCADHETRVLFGDHGIIRRLLSFLSEHDNQTVHDALKLLDLLIEKPVYKRMPDALGYDEENEYEEEDEYEEDESEEGEEENCKRIVDDGGIEILVRLSARNHPKIKDAASSMLEKLARRPAFYECIIGLKAWCEPSGSVGPSASQKRAGKKQSINPAFQILARNVPWERLTEKEKKKFYKSLASCSEDDLLNAANRGCLSFLTAGLERSVGREQSEILKMLRLFVRNSACCDHLAQEGLIKILADIALKSRHPSETILIFEIFYLFSLNPSCHDQMLQEGVISAVAHIFSGGRSPDAKTLSVLWSLSRNDAYKPQVFQTVGAAFLASCVDKEGVKLRDRLSEHHDLKAEIEAARQVYSAALLDALDELNRTERGHASMFLKFEEFISLHELRVDVAQAGGIDRLLNLLTWTPLKTHRWVHRMLLKFTPYDTYRSCIIDDRRVLDSMMKLLVGGRRYHTQSVLVMLDAILNSVSGGEALKRIEEEIILPALRVYAHGDPKVRTEAASALESLAHVADENIVQVWLKCLSDQDEVIQDAAAAVLLRSAMHRPCQVLIATQGLRSFIQIVSDPSHRLRECASKLLSVIVLHPENQTTVLDSRLMGLLLELSSSGELQIDVIRDLLDSLLRMDACRSVLEAGGMRAMITERARHNADASQLLQTWEEHAGLLECVRKQKEGTQGKPENLVLPTASSVPEHIARIDPSELKLGECLGEHAWGKTHRAAYGDRSVVIKMYAGFMEEDRSELLHILERVQYINAPHVVRVLGVVDQMRAPPACVMLWGSGGSLHAYLDQKQVIPWSWMLQVARELASGLAHLHDHDMTHKNIKSSNVILDAQGHAQWSDVGISVWSEGFKEGSVPQSVRWMSPEFIKDGCATKAGDVWAFGMLLSKLASRDDPYRQCTALQAMKKILGYQTKPVLKNCSVSVPHFASLMRRCFKAPDARPSAAELVACLSEPESASKEGSSVLL